MDEPTIAAASPVDAATDGLNGGWHGRSPALRLLSDDGRLIRGRPAVVAAGLAARLHALRGHAIWPSAGAPVFGVEPAAPRSATWLSETFESGDPARRATGVGAAIRAAVGAATWSSLRAGAFLLGRPPAWLLELCGDLLDREASRWSLTLFSRSGASQSKAIYFLFEPGASQPSLVVLAMADPAQSHRLEFEYDAVAGLAGSLRDDAKTAEALPLEPLFRGSVAGEYLVVVPPDPLAQAIGSEDRTPALDWLLSLQTATGSDPRSWGDADDDELLAVVEDAWSVLRPAANAAVHDRVAGELGRLHGSAIRRCAVHGDYWHGNIAVDGDRLRVYDWEWASMDGLPFLDLWTYEFGVLLRPPRGGAPPGGLAAASERVAAELARREIPREFALATVAPSLAQLAIRMRRATGRPGPAEAALGGLIEEAERLLLED
jgi:hypothetical protein